ncbi:TPA: hypothetical protein RRW83_001449 [Klebsiella pneumoniae]|nr:hypothetical protein [Klebsiella pneumoniae]
MKIRSQVGMVLNLDKCIGCHTCSVTCKNVWSSREGMEYAWFNNVETKPGIGYPKNWEDQDQWQGGWIRGISGKLTPRLGNRVSVLSKIFANPVLPAIDDYYEPFMAIANYEDRFVIPTSHRELAEDAFPERNGCGFTFGDGCHGSDTKFNLFNSRRIDAIDVSGVRKHGEGE